MNTLEGSGEFTEAVLEVASYTSKSKCGQINEPKNCS